MKAIVASLMLGFLGIVTTAGTASADWWDKVIAEGKRSSGESARAARPARADVDRSSRRASRSVREAQSEDDGSRPQRRQASTVRSYGGSLSGETGIASYYWQPQRVASGGWFNPNAMTAAHKSLPFGTRVRVTRLDNGNSVTVTINDRGPYVAGRIIDLSRAAAQSLGITGQGLARVSVSRL